MRPGVPRRHKLFPQFPQPWLARPRFPSSPSLSPTIPSVQAAPNKLRPIELSEWSEPDSERESGVDGFLYLLGCFTSQDPHLYMHYFLCL